MKQRITIDQINELSDEQKEQLRKWWNPEEFDVITNCRIAFVPNDYMHPDEYSSYLPLLSIGQMIELIGDNGDVETLAYVLNDNHYSGFCDALWELAKSVI